MTEPLPSAAHSADTAADIPVGTPAGTVPLTFAQAEARALAITDELAQLALARGAHTAVVSVAVPLGEGSEAYGYWSHYRGRSGVIQRLGHLVDQLTKSAKAECVAARPPTDAENAIASIGPVTELAVPLRINLNARVRVHLTLYGVSLLYAARTQVIVPPDLLHTGGVWETTLALFMIVMGNHLNDHFGEVPVERFCIELLDPAVVQPEPHP